MSPYIPHAIDWMAIGELVGAVVSLVIMTIGATNFICDFSDWYKAWWLQYQAQDDPRSPEELNDILFPGVK